jgi:hypothetical protein
MQNEDTEYMREIAPYAAFNLCELYRESGSPGIGHMLLMKWCIAV